MDPPAPYAVVFPPQSRLVTMPVYDQVADDPEAGIVSDPYLIDRDPVLVYRVKASANYQDIRHPIYSI